MHKRLIIVIQPAVKHHQSEHEPLRIRAEVRFPETKFIKIQSGAQSLFIKSVYSRFLQFFPDRLFKRRKLFPVRAFRHDGKIRLHDSVFITAVHILADTLIDQRLF